MLRADHRSFRLEICFFSRLVDRDLPELRCKATGVTIADRFIVKGPEQGFLLTHGIVARDRVS